MRYYGVLTGKIFDKKVQMRREQPDESSESWDCFYAGVSNVVDENGNSYGDLLIWLSGKTALRFEPYIVKDNKISFDCSSINEKVIKGIRNVCSNYCVVGFNASRRVVDNAEYQKQFKKNISCTWCKYANNKGLCEKYKAI